MPRRCSKHRKTGQPCRAWAVSGSEPAACRMHIGRSKQVVHAMAEAGRLARTVGTDMHPLEHLLDSLYRAAAEVEVYGQFIADLDNAGEVKLVDEPGKLRGWAEWRTEIDPVTGSDRRVLDHDPLLVRSSENTVHMHPFVTEYNQALERRAKFAKMAIDAGVAEREVQVAEAQAVMLAAAIRSILTDLGVPQNRATVSVVQSHLRALSAGGRPHNTTPRGKKAG